MDAQRTRVSRRLRSVLEHMHAPAAAQVEEEPVPDYALQFKDLPEDVEDMAELIRTDGFIRFPSAITPEHADQLVASIFALKPEQRWNDGFPADGPDAKYGPHLVGTELEGTHVLGDYHLKNMWNRHVDFLNLVDRYPVCDTVEAVMGGDAHIIGLTGWVTGPGRADQGLHLDYLPLEVPEDILRSGRVVVPVMIMTAHYYLDDVDEELGPTVSASSSLCVSFQPPELLLLHRNSSQEATWPAVGRRRRRASLTATTAFPPSPSWRARATASCSAQMFGTADPRTRRIARGT